MILFKSLLTFPNPLKDRLTSLKNLKSKIINITNDDSNRKLITTQCGEYLQTFHFDSDKIILTSGVEVNCDCKSFCFEFSRIFALNNSLYNKQDYLQYISKSPKEINTRQVISGCKHIITSANLIWSSIRQIK